MPVNEMVVDRGRVDEAPICTSAFTLARCNFKRSPVRSTCIVLTRRAVLVVRGFDGI